jgi:hypothetical protein
MQQITAVKAAQKIKVFLLLFLQKKKNFFLLKKGQGFLFGALLGSEFRPAEDTLAGGAAVERAEVTRGVPGNGRDGDAAAGLRGVAGGRNSGAFGVCLLILLVRL